MKSLFSILLLMLFSNLIQAQGVSINGNSAPPDPSAIVDIQSTTKGLLIPRMTIANRDMIATPAAGLMIYQTNGVPGLYMFDGSAWQVLTTASNVWSTAGNSGTDPANAFIGTSDNQPLRLRINNLWAGELNYGNKNISLGDSSGIQQDSFYNTSLGHKSLQYNVNGSRNTATGYEALSGNLGSRNVAVGFRALKSNDIGSDNTAVGEKALEFNFNGNQNTATGRWALNFNVSGQRNTGIGFGALSTNFHGGDNVAIGHKAIFNASFAVNSVAIGAFALENQTASCFDNIAIGYASMRNNQQGTQNIAIGKEALQGSSSGGNNGYSNVAIGSFVLTENATGYFNTAIGFESLKHNTSGHENTAIGTGSLSNNQAGVKNTAVGKSAMANTNTSYNTAVGWEAMFENTSGTNNTAVGADALRQSIASFNTGVGASVLYNNVAGHDNVALGYNALVGNTSGEYNTAIGSNALIYNSSGDFHIAVGYNSGTESGYPNLNNTIGIGNAGILNAISNQAIIGNSAMSYIGGFQPWTVFSDARMKSDVREDVVGLDFINRLRPVTYFRDVDIPAQITGDEPLPDFPHKYDVESVRQTGFLAQEVEAAASACGYDFSGVTIPRNEHMLYAVSYESFVVPLVKAVQEQQAIIYSQQQHIHTLEARLNAIESLIQNSLPKTR